MINEKLDAADHIKAEVKKTITLTNRSMVNSLQSFQTIGRLLSTAFSVRMNR